MPKSISIRPVTIADAPAVAAIYEPIVRDTAISFETTPPSPATMAERIEAALPTYPWLVAVSGGVVAGYVYASQHRPAGAYRWSVNVTAYVAEPHRGQGVAGSLYRTLFDILEAQGFRSAFAGIALPNAASVALHESVGFEALGVYRDVGYKLGLWRDVGWWRRTLSEGAGEPVGPTPFAVFRETADFKRILG